MQIKIDDSIVQKIKDNLLTVYPNIDGYFASDIKELVQHFTELGKMPEKARLPLTLKERHQIDCLENVIEQIKVDLIESRHNYLWQGDEPKDDYERGILNVIRLIQHRVHCILD